MRGDRQESEAFTYTVTTRVLNGSPNWQSPSRPIVGSDDAVHVWRASSGASSSMLAALMRLLSTDESERIARFQFARDRRCFLVSRGLLRVLLAQYLGFEPAALRFRYGSYGKPELADSDAYPDLQFNISHSGSLILLAFAWGRRIGVDAEKVRSFPDAANVAMRFFSPQERASFAQLPEAKRHAAFFTCWTRKESFIKAIGEGLSYPLDSFDVPVAPETPARLIATRSDPDAAVRWRLYDLEPGPGYVAAVAVEGNRWRLQCLDVAESILVPATRIAVSTQIELLRDVKCEP